MEIDSLREYPLKRKKLAKIEVAYLVDYNDIISNEKKVMSNDKNTLDERGVEGSNRR